VVESLIGILYRFIEVKMTTNRIDFQAGLKKAVIPRLSVLGYQKIYLPMLRGAPVTFFQKHLFENYYGYIFFQIHPWAPAPAGFESMPRLFSVHLIRNIGEEPDNIPKEYPYYLHNSLSYYLWNGLDNHKYESMYHEWEFHTKENLVDQLTLATEDLVAYGIPYLEDMNSKNPLLKSGKSDN
jgi:hypothetical protein